jgi:hypothetical protein
VSELKDIVAWTWNTDATGGAASPTGTKRTARLRAMRPRIGNDAIDRRGWLDLGVAADVGALLMGVGLTTF